MLLTSSCVTAVVLSSANVKDIFLRTTGQSVGSGPTCYLGAKVPGLAGVILHSPLATGMRVMNPTWTRWPSWLDVFPNIKLISKINAPTLIMHVRPWLLCTAQL